MRVEVVSLVIAFLSMTGALVFGGLQLRESAEQQRFTNRTLQLQLIQDATVRFNRALGVLYSRNVFERDLRKRSPLQFRVLALAGEAENVAFLVNHRIVTVPEFIGHWKDSATCVWITIHLTMSRRVRRAYPELDRFTEGGTCTASLESPPVSRAAIESRP